MKRVLFEPFSAGKWFKLGLIAFLGAVTGGGGGSGGGGGGGGPGGGGGRGGTEAAQAWDTIVTWCQAHWAEIIGITMVVIAALLVIGLVMTYVSSVFRFIFLESVITNETRIGEAWRRNKAAGLSYFFWRIGFGLASLVFTVALVAWPGMIWVRAVGWRPGDALPDWPIIAGTVGLLLLAVGALAVAAIVVSIITTLVRDFVLPLMYVRQVRVLEAWGEFWGLLRANLGGFVVYLLLKIVLSLGAGIASIILGCLGILVALLPVGLVVGVGFALVSVLGINEWNWMYLWTIVPIGLVTVLALGYWMVCVTLPVPVFMRSYALKYLEYVEPAAATIP